MKKLADISIYVAIVSIVLGLISRITFRPLLLGLQSRAFIGFAGVLLLLAIAIMIKEQGSK